jgi:guanylate kinase
VASDDRLHLSRSWTTRPRRPNESEDAYVFVDEATFRRHAEAGGFLEWVELWPGQLSGTPLPEELPEGHDLLLEIDVRGGELVRANYPDTVLVLLVPPSEEELLRRLRHRGDPEEKVQQRLAIGRREVERGQEVADHIVVNDDVDRAVAELAGILASRRSSAARDLPGPGEQTT